MRALKNGLIVALCLSGCARAPADSQDESNISFMELDQLDLRNGGGVYTSTRAGVTVEVPFEVDTAKLDPVRRHDSEPVGQTADGVIVLLDRYASKAASDGRCVTGIESFVRVFSVRERKALLAVPAESCLDGRTASDAKVAWLAPDGFQVGDRRYSIRGQTIVVRTP